MVLLLLSRKHCQTQLTIVLLNGQKYSHAFTIFKEFSRVISSFWHFSSALSLFPSQHRDKRSTRDETFMILFPTTIVGLVFVGSYSPFLFTGFGLVAPFNNSLTPSSIRSFSSFGMMIFFCSANILIMSLTPSPTNRQNMLLIYPEEVK